MLDVEFDRFAEQYEEAHAASIRMSGEAPSHFHRSKIVDLAGEVASAGISARRIVDFGGGVGNSLPYLRDTFPEAEIICLDPSRRSLDIAQARYPGVAIFQDFDGETIPLPDGSVDVVFAACVFHHIPETVHARLLGEIRRILSIQGLLMLYEHNPLNPLTRHAVRNCIFDENAVLINAGHMSARVRESGLVDAKVRYRTFFPRLLARLRPLESLLKAVPLGAQYYVSARKPRG